MIFGWDNNYSGCLFVDAGNNHIVNIPNDITFETKKVDKIIDSTVYVENEDIKMEILLVSIIYKETVII